MGDSLPLRDILPTLTLRVQRGRTLVRSWIFLPHATYLVDIPLPKGEGILEEQGFQ
jgi:hypothetical protein